MFNFILQLVQFSTFATALVAGKQDLQLPVRKFTIRQYALPVITKQSFKRAYRPDPASSLIGIDITVQILFL